MDNAIRLYFAQNDDDYLRLAAEGFEHTGIIIAQQRETSIGDWIRALELICRVYGADEMRNQIEYL